MCFNLNRKTPHDMKHEVLKNDTFTTDKALLTAILDS